MVTSQTQQMQEVTNPYLLPHIVNALQNGHARRSKSYYPQLRRYVLDQYGNRCSCCKCPDEVRKLKLDLPTTVLVKLRHQKGGSLSNQYGEFIYLLDNDFPVEVMNHRVKFQCSVCLSEDKTIDGKCGHFDLPEFILLSQRNVGSVQDDLYLLEKHRAAYERQVKREYGRKYRQQKTDERMEAQKKAENEMFHVVSGGKVDRREEVRFTHKFGARKPKPVDPKRPRQAEQIDVEQMDVEAVDIELSFPHNVLPITSQVLQQVQPQPQRPRAEESDANDGDESTATAPTIQLPESDEEWLAMMELEDNDDGDDPPWN